MVAASVEVSGPDSERSAAQLRAALVSAGPSQEVSPVEVERSADLVIAVIGLVLSGVGTAKTIWDWWHSHRAEGSRVSIVFEDGTRVDLANVDRAQLEIEFRRRITPVE